ncbi:hypothetical protein B0F90DRAFT_1779756, partial [Multifurca ochricompacta]
MFDEDCCLQCGKPMRVDNRIYCSDACQALDDSSPSLSTASSAWPSPSFLPVSTGPTQEPPSLTLGMSLSSAKTAYSQQQTYPIWYDDDEEVDVLSVHPSDDALLRSHEALSYARRPSSTNTHSTIPLLHRHSSSSTTHSSGGQSTNSAEEDSDISGPTSSSHHHHLHHHRRRSYGTPLRPSGPLPSCDISDGTITSRKRNRASLPAYFSLLTLGAPHAKSSLTMSPPRSSADTARARPSPTIPRLSTTKVDHTHAMAGKSPSSAPLSVLDGTEEGRGRRREPGSTSHHVRPRSPSRSRSRSHFHSLSRSPSRECVSGRDDIRGRRRVTSLMAGLLIEDMGTVEGVVDYGIVLNACTARVD